MKKCLAAAVAALLLVACNGEPDPRTLPPRVDRLQGRVVEQIDSAPYSFFRIETADGPLAVKRLRRLRSRAPPAPPLPCHSPGSWGHPSPSTWDRGETRATALLIA